MKYILSICIIMLTLTNCSSVKNKFTPNVEVIKITKSDTYKSPKSILFIFEGDTHLINYWNDLRKYLKRNLKNTKIAFNYNLESKNPLSADLKEIPQKRNSPKNYEVTCTFQQETLLEITTPKTFINQHKYMI